MQAELILDAKALLAEGPIWDHRENILNWVDIENGTFNFFDPVTLKNEQYRFPDKLGVGIPSNIPGKYILGLQNGLAIFDREHPTALNYIADPEAHIKNNRFNDGKCDPEGRLWIGTMAMDEREATGSLYFMDYDYMVTQKLTNIFISNGLAWDTEKQIMYYIDTFDYCVYAFDYQKEDGSISNKRIVVNVPEQHGSPDGMTIDEEGMLWIAHWGGFNVTRWDPKKSRILDKIEVPAPQPTSCIFGGENMDILYITSARVGLSDEVLKAYPSSGGIFATQTKVKGKKADFFQLKSR